MAENSSDAASGINRFANPAPSVRDGIEARVGYAGFVDGTFELIVEAMNGKSVTLSGKLQPGQSERMAEILPTCVMVPAVLASAPVPDQSGVGGDVLGKEPTDKLRALMRGPQPDASWSNSQTGASSTTTGLLPDGPTASRSSGFAAAIPLRKPNWIDRAAWCAEQLLPIIPDEWGEQRDADNEAVPGTSIPHLRWMARQLAERQLDSETKACRWLGWLQHGVVSCCLSTLEDEKERNLASAIEALQGQDLGLGAKRESAAPQGETPEDPSAKLALLTQVESRPTPLPENQSQNTGGTP